MTRAWFPFYPADWLCDEDVCDMTLAQQGAYVRLLGHQWREGSVPAEPDRLRKLVRCSQEEFELIWQAVSKKFLPYPDAIGRLRNDRLYREYLAAKEIADKAVSSAKKRWNKPNAVAMPTQCEGSNTQHCEGNARAGAGECVGDSEVLSFALKGESEGETADPVQQQLIPDAPDLGKAPDAVRRVVDRWLPQALEVFRALQAARKRVIQGSRATRPTYTALAGIAGRLDAGQTLEECLTVVANCEAECRVNPASQQYFDAISPWRAENFERKLSANPRASPASRSPSVGRAEPGGHNTETRILTGDDL